MLRFGYKFRHPHLGISPMSFYVFGVPRSTTLLSAISTITCLCCCGSGMSFVNNISPYLLLFMSAAIRSPASGARIHEEYCLFPNMCPNTLLPPASRATRRYEHEYLFVPRLVNRVSDSAASHPAPLRLHILTVHQCHILLRGISYLSSGLFQTRVFLFPNFGKPGALSRKPRDDTSNLFVLH